MASDIAKTRPLYLSNSKIFETDAIVTLKGTEEIKGKIYTWIHLDQTVFHPHGGGQPSDKGTINDLPVSLVLKKVLGAIDNFEVLHCFEQDPSFEIGQKVHLKVDEENRRLNMRMHSAGHAIAHYVETLYPYLKGVGGNHAPNDGYLKLETNTGEFPTSPNELKESLEKALAEAIDCEVPTQIIEEDGSRKLKVGDFESVPCGGTHVSNLSELEKVLIGLPKFNAKEKRVTVPYSVSGNPYSKIKE